MRVIPKDKWAVIENDPNVHATALSTISGAGRYQITCDDTDPIPKRVIGKIESVMHSQTHTTISGWACNYTDPNAIEVKVYAKAIGRHHFALNEMTFITQATSNLSPKASVSFNCGYLSNQGKKFSIQIPNSELARFSIHKFYVNGLSNSNGAHNFLIDSGKYSVLPRRLDKIDRLEIKKSAFDTY